MTPRTLGNGYRGNDGQHLQHDFPLPDYSFDRYYRYPNFYPDCLQAFDFWNSLFRLSL